MSKNSKFLSDARTADQTPNSMPPAEGDPELLILKVGSSIKHRRLDKYLHNRFSAFSRVMIQKQILAGNVRVNGKVARPSFKLSRGDTIELTLPQLPSKDIPPEDIPLNIIYEDDDLIILNKCSACIR